MSGSTLPLSRSSWNPSVDLTVVRFRQVLSTYHLAELGRTEAPAVTLRTYAQNPRWCFDSRPDRRVANVWATPGFWLRVRTYFVRGRSFFAGVGGHPLSESLRDNHNIYIRQNPSAR
jgi:hypothetical protein